MNYNRSFYLHAGPGAFATQLVLGKIQETNTETLYARCRTWLPQKVLGSDRAPLPPAASPDRSMATLLLNIARNGGAATQTPPPPLPADFAAARRRDIRVIEMVVVAWRVEEQIALRPANAY